MALPIFFNVGNSNQSQAPQSGAVIPQALHSVTIDLACTLPHNELARLYRAIETALSNRQHHVVQFASAYNNEGTDTIAFEMAIVAARLIGKRVLFIDTSALQGNSSGRKLPDNVGVPLDTLLLTGRPPHEAIVQVAGTDLYLAMLRERGQAEFAPISLSAIAAALENLRSSFDLIVIDSQNVMTDAFGIALAKLVDGTVLVVEAERTRSPVAIESQRMIEAGGGHVIGAVLNKRRFFIPRFLYRLLYRHSAA